MDSHFWAKWLGLYLLILAIIATVRRQQFDNAIRDIFASPAMQAISGALSLLFGLYIVVVHPVWRTWRVAITAIGYISFIIGIMRLAYPELCGKIVNFFLTKARWFLVLFLYVTGVILSFLGFLT